jgi:hypothetical protein
LEARCVTESRTWSAGLHRGAWDPASASDSVTATIARTPGGPVNAAIHSTADSLFSAAQCAEYLGLSIEEFNQLRGDLPARRVGGALRFRRADIDRYLLEQQIDRRTLERLQRESAPRQLPSAIRNKRK